MVIKVRFKMRDQRLLKMLTLEELAEKVGVSQGFLSDVENGNKVPSLAVACKIATALGCTLNDIIECEKSEGE